MAAHGSSLILRGELFKAGEGNSIYKLRWFELLALGTGELRWAEAEGAPGRGITDLFGATVHMGPDESRAGEERFGFQILPRGGMRTYALQASSAEERRLWVDAIETVASPHVMRSALGGSYRLVQMRRPPPPLQWGIDLGSAMGLPCVTVLEVSGDEARAAGLLAGDVVLALDSMVLRTASVAQRAFREASGTVTLRLATRNREITLWKREGIAGIACIDPPSGVGAIVCGLLAGSAGAESELQVGDRLLAVNGKLVTDGHDQFSKRISQSPPELRLVVSGYTSAHTLHKDAEGVLGVRLCDGARGSPPVLSQVQRSSPAWSAGLRAGDVLVSVDGAVVFDAAGAIRGIAESRRALPVVIWRPALPAEDGAAGAAGGVGGMAVGMHGSTGLGNKSVTAHTVEECYYLPHAWHKQKIYEDLTALDPLPARQSP